MRHPLRRALPLLALLAVAGAPLAAMTLVMPADGVLADQAALVVEATDGQSRWDAGCVSDNVIEASFEALCSTSVMGIVRARGLRRAYA